MNIKLDYDSLSLWQVIASHFPFKSRKYVAKWAKFRKDWIDSIQIKYDDECLIAFVNWKLGFIPVEHGIFDRICQSFSMRDLWDKLLEHVTELENMRNVDELKIWLDMHQE